MSVTAMSRTFWTDFPPLAYTDKKGKQITIKDTTAKIVLLAIADNADDFGENSYQSFETLATKASVDRRSVMRVVRALVANGFLQVAGVSAYGTNNYTVCLDKLGHPPKKRAKTGRPKSGDSEALDLKGSDPEVKTGDPEVKSGDSVTKSDDPASPESSFNPPSSIQKTKEDIQKIKDSCLEILQDIGRSVFGNDLTAWWNFRRRLEKDDVVITGDKKLMTVAGLSAQMGQFTEAEVYQDRYAPYFAKFGLLIRFQEQP